MSLPGAAGTLTAGFDTYRDARNAACFAYRNDLYGVASRYLAASGQPAMTPQALADYYLFNGAMNDFCRDTPSPAELFDSPYSGGQCVELYNITTAWSARFISSGVRDSGSGTQTNVLGALGAIREIPQSGSPTQFWGIEIANGLGSGTPSWTSLTTAYNKAFWDQFEFQLISVVRADGQPDNCGSPSPFPDYRFFDSNNPPPPPTIRVPDPAGGAGIEVEGDVNFNLDGSFDVSFGGANINFSPQVEASGGIFFGPQYNGGGFTAGGGSYTPPPAGEPGGSSSTEQIETVRETIDRVETNTERIEEKLKPCCPALADCQVVGAGGGQSRVYVASRNIAYARLVLTEIPDNARVQSGVDAPDVYYSGWYAWGEGGSAGDRNAVHFQENFIPAPCGCNTFSYTLYEGFNGVLTIYLEPLQDET